MPFDHEICPTEDLPGVALATPVDASDLCITQEWLGAMRSAGRSPNTIESYRRAVMMLRDWRLSTGSDPSLGDLATVSRHEALAFARWLGEKYTPGGRSVRLRALRAGWSWMLAEELVEANVFARLKLTVPEVPQRTADEDEVQAMLDRAKRGRNPRRDVAIITLLVDTGARRKELSSVEFADVDLHSGVLSIRVSKTRARQVPLSDRAASALVRWLRERGTKSGSLWNSDDPYSMLDAVVLRHSKGQLRCHALRRAFCVRWLERGGSEVGLCRVAGWSSLAMVRKYSAAQADRLSKIEMRRIIN